MFVNRILRKMSSRKRDEVTGGWIKLHEEGFDTLPAFEPKLYMHLSALCMLRSLPISFSLIRSLQRYLIWIKNYEAPYCTIFFSLLKAHNLKIMDTR
jgi:hypothetical protein